MLVLSIDKSCISASTPRISKIFSNMLSLDHLLNLSYRVLQEPYRSGKSLHGAPLRTIQSIPFNAVRLFPDGLPGLPVCSGGSKALIRSHSSSLISYRLRLVDIIPLPDYCTIFWSLCHYRTHPSLILLKILALLNFDNNKHTRILKRSFKICNGCYGISWILSRNIAPYLLPRAIFSFCMKKKSQPTVVHRALKFLIKTDKSHYMCVSFWYSKSSYCISFYNRRSFLSMSVFLGSVQLTLDGLFCVLVKAGFWGCIAGQYARYRVYR